MGTSFLRLLLYFCHEDHPHAYGDKKDDQYLIVSAKGSSPRVWGQELKKLNSIHTSRIIPTRMGTRIAELAKLFTEQGSSPRVWGQVLLCKLILNRFRIIPTRMGTSCTCVLVCCCVWDHPHAYGDKPRGDMQRILRIGSSPRVWGQGICSIL